MMLSPIYAIQFSQTIEEVHKIHEITILNMYALVASGILFVCVHSIENNL